MDSRLGWWSVRVGKTAFEQMRFLERNPTEGNES